MCVIEPRSLEAGLRHWRWLMVYVTVIVLDIMKTPFPVFCGTVKVGMRHSDEKGSPKRTADDQPCR